HRTLATFKRQQEIAAGSEGFDRHERRGDHSWFRIPRQARLACKTRCKMFGNRAPKGSAICGKDEFVGAGGGSFRHECILRHAAKSIGSRAHSRWFVQRVRGGGSKR